MKNHYYFIHIFFLFLFIFTLIINLNPNLSMAYSTPSPYDIVPLDTSGGSDKIGKISGIFLNIVRIISVAIAVIMLLILAIKYISAAPNDKAEIKKHAVVYVVGAIVMFSVSGLLGIIKVFSEENIK